MKLPKLNKRGLSLAELLVAVFILAIGVLSAVMFFANAIASTEFANNITIATSHAEHILEEMRTRSSLSNITSTNWSTWGQDDGMITLPSETISVTYTNPLANPLEAAVAIGWTKSGRTSNVTMTTRITK
ncbi:MAG: prepilin-type N-terminal cleavage/methylation domain-containing protein [Candidatus Omnitrophota bacterium]